MYPFNIRDRNGNSIKTNHNKGIALIFLILMLLLSANCMRAEIFLRADTATMTMPDGRQIHMWGFARDSAFGAMMVL
jgi:hypothetical protein